MVHRDERRDVPLTTNARQQNVNQWAVTAPAFMAIACNRPNAHMIKNRYSLQKTIAWNPAVDILFRYDLA